MSKSKGNTVDPQELIEKYGADTVRLFIMFASPPEQSLEWSDTAVDGAFRFLKRLWKFATQVTAQAATELNKADLTAGQRDIRHKIHATIVKVNDDIGRRYTFNTAIAAVMELMNVLVRNNDKSANGRAIQREGLDTVVLLLAPIVPHITAAIWRESGHSEPIIDAPWPAADTEAMQKNDMRLAIQINGKRRAEITVPIDANEETIKAAALANTNTQRFTSGKEIKKIIVVPKRLVNIVVC